MAVIVLILVVRILTIVSKGTDDAGIGKANVNVVVLQC